MAGAAVDKTEGIVAVKRQCDEIHRGVARGVLDSSDVQRALQAIIDTAPTAQPSEELTRGRFTLPEQQVANVRVWNDKFELNLSDRQLGLILEEIPPFSKNAPLLPLTLCWTLGTLASTIDAKLEIIRLVYGAEKVSVTRDFKTDAKHTTLISGAHAFDANRIWWQLIDVGANRFKAPSQVPADKAAGFEIFDVVCQHPIYMGEQDGSFTPFLDLPGLSVKVRGMPGPDTPDAVGDAKGQVAVHVRWEGGVYPDHAEPVREP
jgi:hypothetical protein